MDWLKKFIKTPLGWLVIGGLLVGGIWASSQAGCQPCVDALNWALKEATKVHEEPVVVPVAE